LAKFAPNTAADSTKSPFAVKGTAPLVLVLLLAALVVVAALLNAEEGSTVPVGTE
jgi:hypothetical protein